MNDVRLSYTKNLRLHDSSGFKRKNTYKDQDFRTLRMKKIYEAVEKICWDSVRTPLF